MGSGGTKYAVKMPDGTERVMEREDYIIYRQDLQMAEEKKKQEDDLKRQNALAEGIANRSLVRRNLNPAGRAGTMLARASSTPTATPGLGAGRGKTYLGQ